MAAYFGIAAASDRIGGLSARNLLYSTARNPRCQNRLHFGSALYGVEVFQTVLYRQPLRRTTLKTPLGLPALPAGDVSGPGTQPQPTAAAHSSVARKCAVWTYGAEWVTVAPHGFLGALSTYCVLSRTVGKGVCYPGHPWLLSCPHHTRDLGPVRATLSPAAMSC
jgi:hypothetical protein